MNNDLETRPNSAIEDVLATEDALVPSSGFAGSVMERVHAEAARTHKPIGFPWRRFLPGLVLVLPGLVYLAQLLIKSILAAGADQANRSIPFTNVSVDFAIAINPQYLQMLLWLAVAAVISLLSLYLARRLAGLR